MDKANVNIIINCYNGEKYLEETLSSVYEQSYENWDIIFFDNASTDSTPDIVSKFDSKIRYIRNENLVPLGQARNMALKYVDADFVAFLDSDDLWHKDKLKSQVELFGKEPTGFVYTNYLKFYDHNTSTHIVLNGNQPVGSVFREMILNGYEVCLSTVMIRTRELKKLKYYFNNKYQIVEEFDLFMRLFSYLKVDYIETPLVYYRIHEGMTTLKNYNQNSLEKYLVYEELFRNNQTLIENDPELKEAFLNKIQRNKALNSFISGNYKSARKHFYQIRNYSSANKKVYYFYRLPSFILRFMAPAIIKYYLMKL